jgi:hypothetical protein
MMAALIPAVGCTASSDRSHFSQPHWSGIIWGCAKQNSKYCIPILIVTGELSGLDGGVMLLRGTAIALVPGEHLRDNLPL